ncbi:unnamed protein product [Effrenium voratum]|nr:unnamed protein product [Effrenium voratum]
MRDCAAPPLAADLVQVVQHLKGVLPAPDQTEVVFTSYGVPSVPLASLGLCSGLGVSTIHDGLLGAVAALNDTKVSLVDLRYSFGGTGDETSYTPSEASFYADAIHLNKAGYDQMFLLPEWQQIFCPGGSSSTGAPAALNAAAVARCWPLLLALNFLLNCSD